MVLCTAITLMRSFFYGGKVGRERIRLRGCGHGGGAGGGSRLAFSSPSVMVGESLSAAPFSLIKLRQGMKPSIMQPKSVPAKVEES